jgi:hypothetical protein
MRALMQRSRIFFAIHPLQDQYHDNASWRAQKILFADIILCRMKSWAVQA